MKSSDSSLEKKKRSFGNDFCHKKSFNHQKVSYDEECYD